MPLNPPAPPKSPTIEQRVRSFGATPAFIAGQLTGVIIVIVVLVLFGK